MYVYNLKEFDSSLKLLCVTHSSKKQFRDDRNRPTAKNKDGKDDQR